MGMQVGAMRLVFRIPGASSLKEKRAVKNRICDRVRAQFDLGISEVEDLDEHRRLVIGVAAVSNDARVLQSTLDKVTEFIERMYVAELVERRVEVHPFG